MKCDTYLLTKHCTIRGCLQQKLEWHIGLVTFLTVMHWRPYHNVSPNSLSFSSCSHTDRALDRSTHLTKLFMWLSYSFGPGFTFFKKKSWKIMIFKKKNHDLNHDFNQLDLNQTTLLLTSEISVLLWKILVVI